VPYLPFKDANDDARKPCQGDRDQKGAGLVHRSIVSIFKWGFTVGLGKSCLAFREFSSLTIHSRAAS
jgi:hypothetical protein